MDLKTEIKSYGDISMNMYPPSSMCGQKIMNLDLNGNKETDLIHENLM